MNVIKCIGSYAVGFVSGIAFLFGVAWIAHQSTNRLVEERSREERTESTGRGWS